MEKGTYQKPRANSIFIGEKWKSFPPGIWNKAWMATLIVPNEHCTAVLPGEIVEIKEKERKVI